MIKIEKSKKDDIKFIHNLQKVSFKSLLEKYKDYDMIKVSRFL